MLTALCVAKKCNMVPMHNRVILVEAHSSQENENDPSISVPPRIEWKLLDNTSESLDDSEFQSYQSSKVKPLFLNIKISKKIFFYKNVKRILIL